MITTSGGSERNRSTTKMISQLSGRMPRLRSSAAPARPARPADDDQHGELDRDHHAGQDVRQVLRHHLGVEEGSTKRSQRRTCGLVPLDLADEGAGALVGRAARRSRPGGPCSTIRPSSMNTTRSAAARAKPISWLTTIMVMPLSRRLAHDLEHRADQLGIERAGRLVEQHHPRLERDRARDGDPLLLAARQLARRVAGAIGEADPLQRGAARARRPRRATCPPPCAAPA